MRHALAAFLKALDVEPDLIEDILMAVGEALANAMEHAYGGDPAGIVELFADIGPEGQLTVDVCDEGRFIEREPRAGRGFGLRIVRNVARAVSIEFDGGTRIRMQFDASSRSRKHAAAR
jgi:anti-sigma regulatory factor (Ser/Thr protein kinase)